MLCDLHVRLRAHRPPCGSGTPHCFSTSTGPFGFVSALALTFLGAFSAVPCPALVVLNAPAVFVGAFFACGSPRPSVSAALRFLAVAAF